MLHKASAWLRQPHDDVGMVSGLVIALVAAGVEFTINPVKALALLFFVWVAAMALNPRLRG